MLRKAKGYCQGTDWVWLLVDTRKGVAYPFNYERNVDAILGGMTPMSPNLTAVPLCIYRKIIYKGAQMNVLLN